MWLSGRGGTLSGSVSLLLPCPHGGGWKLQLPSCTARPEPRFRVASRSPASGAPRACALCSPSGCCCAAPQRVPRAGPSDGWARAAAVEGLPRPARNPASREGQCRRRGGELAPSEPAGCRGERAFLQCAAPPSSPSCFGTVTGGERGKSEGTAARSPALW